MAVGAQISEALNLHHPETADDFFFHFLMSNSTGRILTSAHCLSPHNTRKHSVPLPQCTAAWFASVAQSICFGFKIKSEEKKGSFLADSETLGGGLKTLGSQVAL